MALPSLSRVLYPLLQMQRHSLSLGASRMVTSSPGVPEASEPAFEEKTPPAGPQPWGDTRIAEVLRTKDYQAWLWCSHDDRVFDAVRKMAKNRLGSLLVFDPHKLPKSESGPIDSDAVEGIVTERDYLTKVAVEGRTSQTTRVSEIMTPKKKLQFVTPEHTVIETMQLMVDTSVRHVPVVVGDKIVGMISIRDVVKAMVDEYAAEVTQLTNYISGSY